MFSSSHSPPFCAVAFGAIAWSTSNATIPIGDSLHCSSEAESGSGTSSSLFTPSRANTSLSDGMPLRVESCRRASRTVAPLDGTLSAYLTGRGETRTTLFDTCARFCCLRAACSISNPAFSASSFFECIITTSPLLLLTLMLLFELPELAMLRGFSTSSTASFRSFAVGIGSVRYMNGSNVTDTFLHCGQITVERYWPWNRSTMCESCRSLCRRHASRATDARLSPARRSTLSTYGLSRTRLRSSCSASRR
mmetsp:Transcript_6614/g.17798  ORF Transcript_6614/g.17798 Transcript_6614/m.17798 type:complete len:251 (+) Transcript_6614:773-1525(+)